MPQNASFLNNSLKKEKGIVEKFGSMNEYLNKTEVSCKTQYERSIYISSEGLVFPCCWTANQLYIWYKKPGSTQVEQIINSNGGRTTLELDRNNLSGIISSKVFRAIEESWKCSSVEEGKIAVCAKTCGTSFDQFKDQYE